MLSILVRVVIIATAAFLGGGLALQVPDDVAYGLLSGGNRGPLDRALIVVLAGVVLGFGVGAWLASRFGKAFLSAQQRVDHTLVAGGIVGLTLIVLVMVVSAS